MTIKIPMFRAIVLVLILAAAIQVGCQNLKPLPTGTSYQGQPYASKEVVFLTDTTWVDPSGERHIQQAIFDEILQIIANANHLIVLDFFLFNDFQGPVPETTRSLSRELTDALIAKKVQRPEIEIVFITDPINTLYGGLPLIYLERLEQAEVRVAVTNLHRLHDSNPIYSVFWRLFAQPFGNSEASTLPNPIGPGRVSIRTYLELINFKANHRKLIVADQGDDYVGLVTSANPHDGSSAHRNAAIRFTGAAVADLLVTENAVLALSGYPVVEVPNIVSPEASELTVQVVTEGKIKQAILRELNATDVGDEIDLMMFYLSDRKIINAIKRAFHRGAQIRLLLDPNKDAFGRKKNGIPNRPVAHELHASGIPIRWCSTLGEQCHSKTLMIHRPTGRNTMILGSANFTRRNLSDFNLETNIVVMGDSQASALAIGRQEFEDQWNNVADRTYSLPYQHYADSSWWHRLLYWFTESTGFSSY